MKKAKKLLANAAILCLLLGLLVTPAFAIEAPAEWCTDVEGHWAAEVIAKWLEGGLIAGYPDGTFRPDREVSRVEFISFVNRAFGLEETTEISFTDVPELAWYAEQVAIAVAAGYAEGNEDGTFGPEELVTREEAAVMLFKLLGLEAVEEDLLADFTDADQITAENREAMNAVVAAGLLVGYEDSTLRPGKVITRAEALAVIDRALEKAAELQKAHAVVTVVEGQLEAIKEVTIESADLEGAVSFKIAGITAKLGESVTGFMSETEEVVLLDAAGYEVAKATLDFANEYNQTEVEFDLLPATELTVTLTVVEGELAAIKAVTLVETNILTADSFKIAGITAKVGETVTGFMAESEDLAILNAEGEEVAAYTIDFTQEYDNTVLVIREAGDQPVVVPDEEEPVQDDEGTAGDDEQEPVGEAAAVLTVEDNAVLPVFKNITVVSTTVEGAVSFAVAGDVKAIGETKVGMFSNSAELSLLDADGNVLATYTIDFSNTYDNTTVEVVLK